MKILTKKKQEQILELLIKIGTTLAVDGKIPPKAYSRVNEANYDIADLVGGLEMITQYHYAIDAVIQNELAKMGGK